MHDYSTTPIGVPSKSSPTHFDRQLSLAIDAIHDELDRLSFERGLRVWWQRFVLRWQLRRLEAQVPR